VFALAAGDQCSTGVCAGVSRVEYLLYSQFPQRFWDGVNRNWNLLSAPASWTSSAT